MCIRDRYNCWQDKLAFQGLFGLIDNPSAEAGRNALKEYRLNNSYAEISRKASAAQREKSSKAVEYDGKKYEAIADLRREYSMGWYKFSRLVNEGEIVYL